MILKMRDLILIVFLIFQSCSIPSENMEVNVINDVFLELVGTDNYLEPLPIPPYHPIHPDSLDFEFSDAPLIIKFDGISDTIKIDKEKLKSEGIKEYESFNWTKYYKEVDEFEYKLNNRKADSARLVVLIGDTLITLKRTKSLNSILTENGFPNNFGVDTTWRSLALKLVDSNMNPNSINLNDITNTGRYEVENSNNYKSVKGERVIGYVTFSRVAFNDDLTRGCFYYSFVCGGECGEGAMIFIKKMDNKWIIEGSRQLWIS